MKKSKIFALIVSVLLALTLTACSTITIVLPYDSVKGFFSAAGAPADNTASDAAPSADETPASEDSAPTDVPTDAPASDAPATDAPATDAPATDSPATDAPATDAAPVENTTAAPAPTSSVPSTKEEIIDYSVKAYNKIATDAKSVTRTYDYTSNYNKIIEINNNSTLESLANTLMTKFMVENKDAVAGSASDLPPVGVTKLSISPSQIGSASIKDQGSYYEVTLTSTGTDSNYEIDAKPGSGSAGVIGPLLRTEDVSGAAGSLIKFEGLHAWYATANVTAKIDKASGHITEMSFNTPCILHFDSVTAAVVVKVSNCNLGLLFQQVWKIAY